MNEEAKHTDYRLEVWNGKEYIRTYAYSDGSRDEHNNAIRALFDGKGDDLLADPKLMTYRIVRCDKKRTMRPTRKDMNWSSISNRRRFDDGMTVQAQAQVAAEHYQRLRQRASYQDQLVEIPVYPVKKSGRGIAAEFRSDLARVLTNQVPMTTETFWSKTADQTRQILEGRLAAAGYTFTEVDTGDYA